MKLPVLNYPEGHDLTVSTCFGTDQCTPCQLFAKNGGRCDGCTPFHKEKLTPNFRECYKECATCVGHNVQVSAICCRSPLRDIWMQAVTRSDNWNTPKLAYRERPSIKLKEHGVFYATAGSVGTIVRSDGYLVPPTTEAVAVSLSRIWTGKKFATADVHDYLRIPTHTKLILLTMNRDDILEQAWNAEIYADPYQFERMGFSYWMPIQFSAYGGDARMQQYFQFVRTALCIEKSQAWFAPGGFRRPGVRIDDLMDAVVEKIPQITFNAQFLSNKEMLLDHLGIVKWFHDRYPEHVSFWFVGAATPTYLHNIRKLVGTRPCYFVSGNPHHFAAQGKELFLSGLGKRCALPKNELATLNLERYQHMVREYGDYK